MKTAYNGVAVPTEGKAIGYAGGVLQVPDNPIIPFIEGDGTGRDIWKASRRVFDAAVEKAYGGKRRVAWFEVFAGEKAFKTFKQWLPDDTVEAARDFRVSDQGTADDAGGRRDSFAERGAAADFGFVRVRAAGAVLQGSSLPRERAGKDGCDDFPGEYRGRVHRDRVEERDAGSEEAAGISEPRDAEGWEETDPLGFGRGNQADFAVRDEAAHAAGDSVRAGAQAAERDDCTQGEYSEVYRRAGFAIGATNWRGKSFAGRR